MSGNAIANSLVQDLDSSLNPALRNPLVTDTLPSGSAVLPSFDPLSAPIHANPPEPQPVPLRPRSVQAAPADGSLRRFGSLGKLFPGAEKLRVYKLDETLGMWSPIGEWTLRAVQHARDLDGFMMEFVKPKYRGGRYKATLFDGQGRSTEAGEVVLQDAPNDAAPVSNNDNVALRMLESMEKMRNQMQQPAPPAPDPIATFSQINRVIKEAKTEDNMQGSLGTLFAAMSQAQATMMQELMKQQQASTQMQNQILVELIKAQQGAQQAALMAPMPPAPPPPAENPVLNQVLQAALPLLLKRVLEPEISTREMISLLTSRNERSDLDAMKEAVNFLRTVQGDQKQASLIDELEKVQRVKELAANLVDGGASGGSPENFWTAISQLFSNKDFAGNLGRMIGSDIDQRRRPAAAAPQLPAPQQAPQLPRAPTVVHNQVPISVAPPAPAPEAPPPVGARRIANGELHVMGEGGKIVRFVENMPALCATITAAETPADRIQTVANTLYQLRAIDAWEPFVTATLQHAVKNEKTEALQALRGWLHLLVQLKMLEQGVAAATFAAFDEHWDSFHVSLAQLMGVQAAATSATAVPAEPAAVGTPAGEPSPSDTEEGGEEESEDE